MAQVLTRSVMSSLGGEVVQRITGNEGLRPLPLNDNKNIDNDLVLLMRSCWHPDPSQRPTAHSIVQQ
jgi:hypothetical protein